MSLPPDATKSYLEYLDKEMTIMGVLATFCAAAAALVVDRVGNAPRDTLFRRLLDGQPVIVFSGAASLLVAGLFFYLQRSRLAHYYGGICMSMTGVVKDEWTTEQWLSEAYSWRTWRRYRAGFGFLTITSTFFLFSIYRCLVPKGPTLDPLPLIVLVVLLLAIAVDAYTLAERVTPNPWLRRRTRR